jgi:hypothetical protein
MNCRRLAIVSLAILSSLTFKSARSQEALEPTVETTALPTPIPQTQPQPPAEEPSETKATETRAEETPKKKTKKKVPVEESGRVLQDMMTAQEFKAAGLEKLSTEELRNLNAWLQGYRQTTETKATEKATAEVKKKEATEGRHKLDTLESHVAGPVPHLTGHSIIKLEDGTMWKQANPEDRYASPPIDRPTAVVTHGIFGYKIRISGLPEMYVDPVR